MNNPFDVELVVKTLCGSVFSPTQMNEGWRSSNSVWGHVAEATNMENSVCGRKLWYNRWMRNWRGIRDKYRDATTLPSGLSGPSDW